MENFFDKIKVASDDEHKKDTMLLESKLQKYMRRHQNLNRVHESAGLEISKLKFEVTNELKIKCTTRILGQILQKSARNVSCVHAQSYPQNQKSKKRG